MKFDIVHSVQEAYRELLMAMARPGLDFDMSDFCGELNLIPDAFLGTQMLSLMLLDQEVSFHVMAPEYLDIADQTQSLTYGRPVSHREADYIFVHHEVADHVIEGMMETAKVGTLINPHESATLVLERSANCDETEVTLTGPGIEDSITVTLPLSTGLIELRESRNAEYPLGIDLILVTADQRVTCLPRTTQIVYEGDDHGLCSR